MNPSQLDDIKESLDTQATANANIKSSSNAYVKTTPTLKVGSWVECIKSCGYFSKGDRCIVRTIDHSSKWIEFTNSKITSSLYDEQINHAPPRYWKVILF